MKAPLYNLLINLAIIATVIVCLCYLSNPLALFGLYFLREIPILINQGEVEEEGEDADGRGMGFHADI